MQIPGSRSMKQIGEAFGGLVEDVNPQLAQNVTDATSVLLLIEVLGQESF